MSVKERKEAFSLAQQVSLRVRRRFIEEKIKHLPGLFRKAFSRFYTLPFIEDRLNNNRSLLLIKERIKRLFLHNHK
jgi:hypothetical protein